MAQAICKERPSSLKVAASGAMALIACTAVILTWSPSLRAQRQVSAAEAQAVLKRCAQCHGPTVQMSTLNLTTREGMLKGGESGPAEVPGNPAASPLYRRVAGLQTPTMPMPPGPPLTAPQAPSLHNWPN